MALALKQLIAPQQLSDSAAVLYTASTITRIDRVSLTNTTGGSVNVTLYIVPGGSSGTAATTIDPAIAVASNTVIRSSAEGQTLNAGDSIVAGASVAASITIMASGITQS